MTLKTLKKKKKKKIEIPLKPIKWPKYLIKLKNNKNPPESSTITGISLEPKNDRNTFRT